MTEEFDIIETFQRIRQRLHDAQQPRNFGSIAAALQEPHAVHDDFNFTVSPLPPDLDWTAIRMEPDRYWTEPELNLDEDEDDDDNDELIHIMDYMAWAHLSEEIKNDICTRFYHGIPAIHQILLTTPDEFGIGGMSVTAATVEIRNVNHTVQLLLSNEVIAWYSSAYSMVDLDDKYYPVFFVYDYAKLGRLFLGAAQLLWNALGYQVCIESERYIWDDETTPWRTANDEELQYYAHNRVKQFGQLSGNFGVFKPKIRNARRRRNLY